MLLHVQRRYYILYLILTFIHFIRISSLFARTKISNVASNFILKTQIKLWLKRTDTGLIHLGFLMDRFG